MRRRFCLLVALAALGLMVGIPTAAAGGGCHPGTDLEMTTGGDPNAFVAECSFEPTVLYVDPGEKVTWTNKDLFDHTVTGAHLSWGSESALSQGDSITYAFKEEGVFPYYCAYHPSMVGAVVVGDAGNAAFGSMAPKIDEVSRDVAAPGTQSSPDTEPAIGMSLIVAVAVGLAALIAIGAFWRTNSLRRRATSAAPAP